MKFSLAALALLPLASAYHTCSDEERNMVPKICGILDQANDAPEKLADALMNSPISAVAKEMEIPAARVLKEGESKALPIVVAHGMGDSCFNSGMKSITKAAGAKVGAYSTCIPTGDSRIKDTINGFLLNMDASVDVFAEGVKNDPELADGFNAFGLSQGNNLIRGYIQKYNGVEGYPTANTFMSICGINAGVGAFPNCNPEGKVIGGICEGITEILGDLAYNSFVQNILFQANYFRDPSKTDSDKYKKYSQLAQWENEGDDVDASRNEKFAMTSQYVWVLGTEDTVVWPREGEQWRAMDPEDPFGTLLQWNETKWYKEDTFGLATADAANKHNFESFDGQHIQFTQDELMGWLEKYFM
ncbi:hypothetical protein TrST_g9549 [Triparma strigata]|uniref:Palmitoyl-protein thioesterase 1 n=1 Tax=Triparma strigata TaxID=1606541 RepID=A0A9W7A9C3_9STRA|nr:hypothetical protein TrST_g9549 [Triparma strigata]